MKKETVGLGLATVALRTGGVMPVLSIFFTSVQDFI